MLMDRSRIQPPSVDVDVVRDRQVLIERISTSFGISVFLGFEKTRNRDENGKFLVEFVETDDDDGDVGEVAV